MAFIVRASVYNAVKIGLQAFSEMRQVSLSEEEVIFLNIHSREKAADLSSCFRSRAGHGGSLSQFSFVSTQAQNLKPHQLFPPPPSCSNQTLLA